MQDSHTLTAVLERMPTYVEASVVYRLTPVFAAATFTVIIVAARLVLPAIATTNGCRPRQLAGCAVIARLVEEPMPTMSLTAIAAIANLMPLIALSAIRFATVRLADSSFAGVEVEIKAIASTKFLQRHRLVLTSTVARLEESVGH